MTKIEGRGILKGSTMKIVSQVAKIAKPLSSVDEMVTWGMVNIMRRTGGIGERFDIDTKRGIRDLVRSG